MRRHLFSCAVIFVLAAGLVCASGTPAAAQDANVREKFDPARDAATDIHNAMKEATSSGRRIILDVGGEWCSWCHKLDKFFEDNADVNEFMRSSYVVVKVNVSKENKNEAVLSRYPAVKGYPHLFVLDASGKLLHSQDTGALESGDHHDRDKVFAFLKEWAPPKKP